MSASRPTASRLWTVWAVGLLVYMLAVFHRSSLAVAGLAAGERFDITASQLATFTMLQLLVYAAMQIPVGLLVDRFGSRSVMLTGTLTLAVAQAGFALAETYPLAVLARVFIGVGDALTFICVLRLVSRWFPTRRIPIVTQLTGTLGQLGAVGAAVPMTWALGHWGWTPAYLTAAGLGLLMAAALTVVVHDSPDSRHLRGPRMSVRAVRASLAASWAHPGTRLGFWMHFTTQFSATALSLLWGYPFLVRGEGRSSHTAGLLLTLMIVAVMLSGPVLGWLVGRHPWHRSTTVLTIVWSIVLVWTAVLCWPGPAPLWLLVVLVVVTGIGGPASMIGFDLGRTSNPGRAPGQRERHHQPGRLQRLPRAGDHDRADPRLAYARCEHGVHPVGVPVGDERPVRPLERGPAPDLALPPPHPRGDQPSRVGGRGHRLSCACGSLPDGVAIACPPRQGATYRP